VIRNLSAGCSNTGTEPSDQLMRTRNNEAFGCWKRHPEDTGGTVATFRATKRAADVIAVVSRLAVRATGLSRKWRMDHVHDADAVTVPLDAGDRERVADRQRWLPFNGLEVKRDRPAPLRPRDAVRAQPAPQRQYPGR